MTPNSKPSEILSLLATINPVSQGVGTVTSGWVAVKNHLTFLALINTGVLGLAATVDAKIQQATSAAGTGAKDVIGKAITQLVKATNDNNQAMINMKVADLDTEGGFNFIQLSITVGAAASLVAGQLFGAHPRYEDASVFNQAAVVQVV